MSEEERKKRDFPRTHCEIKMEYRTAESFMEAYMMQVGKGGLFIRHDNPPMLGDEVEVSFSLPGDAKSIKARGKVVWRMENPYHEVFDKGVGVKFTDISDEARAKIGTFVDHHRSKP